MAWPRRLHDFSVHRVPENAEADGPLHVERVYGQIENIAGGEVVHGVNSSARLATPNSGIRTDVNRISDLTFEIHQANDNPESLGRARVVLRIVDSAMTRKTATKSARLSSTPGFVMQVGRTTGPDHGQPARRYICTADHRAGRRRQPAECNAGGLRGVPWIHLRRCTARG